LKDMHIIQVACGQKHSQAVTTTGYLFGWGNNSCGQLGVGDESKGVDSAEQVMFQGYGPVCVVQVACGHVHSVAVDVKGRVFSWGSNVPIMGASSILIGRLGLGVPSQFTPRHVVAGPMADVAVNMVSVGVDHTVVLTDDGTVVFWGFLRRPHDWADRGYGPIGTATQIIPAVVNGPWETAGGVPCYIASGANKCMVLVDSRPLGGAGALEEPERPAVEMGSSCIKSPNELQQENLDLKRQLAEMASQLNQAEGMVSRYLPMFSIDMRANS